jgi:hypothetical protein
MCNMDVKIDKYMFFGWYIYMITPRSIAENLGILPIPLELFEIIHNISMFLIRDDARDVGRFRYRDRDDHYYKGRLAPHHRSTIHHWQIGVAGLFLSQLGSLMSVGMGVYNDYKKVEAGDLSGIDDDILGLIEDDNTITIDEYKEEVKEISTTIESTSSALPPIPPMPILLGM